MQEVKNEAMPYMQGAASFVYNQSDQRQHRYNAEVQLRDRLLPDIPRGGSSGGQGKENATWQVLTPVATPLSTSLGVGGKGETDLSVRSYYNSAMARVPR